MVFTCAAFLAPAKPLFIGSMVMVAIDFITGIIAAHKRGEPVTSAGLRRTVTKALIYTLAIISGLVAQKLLLEDLVPAAKLIAGCIGVVEIKSVLENCQTILGMSLFEAIMSKFGSNNDLRSVVPVSKTTVSTTVTPTVTKITTTSTAVIPATIPTEPATPPTDRPPEV